MQNYELQYGLDHVRHEDKHEPATWHAPTRAAGSVRQVINPLTGTYDEPLT